MDIRATLAQPAPLDKLVPLANKATSATSAPLDKLAPLANKVHPATLDPQGIRVSLGLTAPTAFSEPLARRDPLAKRAALDTKATPELLESWVPMAKTVFSEQRVIKALSAIRARRGRLALRVTREALDKRVILVLAATLEQPAHKVLWGKTGILGSAVPKVTLATRAQLANKVIAGNKVQPVLVATLVSKVLLVLKGDKATSALSAQLAPRALRAQPAP
jgi:hypothetical protein